MRGTDLFMGLDIGTGSSKAVLTTADGAVVKTVEREHQTSNPTAGWFEHDAGSIWWQETRDLIALLAPDDPAQIKGVAVSGVGPTVLPVDKDGSPLRPAILYGVDTRSVAVAQRMQDELGGAGEMLQRCGSVLTSQAAGPKMVWIRENEPRVWAKASRFHMVNSFIVERLTNEYVLDHHSASQTQPFYDLNGSRWMREWVDRYLPGIQLPRLAWPDEIAGYVTVAAAAETGLAPGTPVAVGTIDAWAEAESVGVSEPGDLMLMYGSTMFFVAVTGARVIAPALWSTQGNHVGQFTLAGGMASSGSITGWLRDLVGGPDFQTLVAEATASPPGSNGVLALPYFAGERTPFSDPKARGIIAGLTLAHTRGDIYRAVLEATAFGVRQNLDAFAESGVLPRRVVAVGGGTKDLLWPQIVSDTIGKPQIIPNVRVGASYGDARFAAIAVGAIHRWERWNFTEEVLRPQAAAARIYDDRYSQYLELHHRTADIQHLLAESAG